MAANNILLAKSSNVLDNLDVMLKATGHETWGWVIYRCTEEDVGWTKAPKGILVGYYADLCHTEFWSTFYLRPPLRAR